MFVDMPPGTGDVPLTVFQSLPVDGIIVVTTPQELVGMVVEKAVKMARLMNIPVLGLVENMSYIQCPDCGKKLFPFGESRLEETAQRLDIPQVARIPINVKLSAASDKGMIELFEGDWLDDLSRALMPVSYTHLPPLPRNEERCRTWERRGTGSGGYGFGLRAGPGQGLPLEGRVW